MANDRWGLLMDFSVYVWEGLQFLLTAAVCFGVGFLPVVWVLRKELSLLSDPANLRRYGVIVRRFDALDSVAETIGRYRDSDIYQYVTFKGMRYDFERIVLLPRLFNVGPNELYIEPGVLYVTRS